MALTVGSRLGHYDVTALIGEGGMGRLFGDTYRQARVRSLCSFRYRSGSSGDPDSGGPATKPGNPTRAIFNVFLEERS